MLSINTNLSSLITQSSLKESTNKLNLAIERMSTGFKVNHAKDNAANYSISTNMTTKINSYMVAEDNAAMGLDMVSTAEGTLSQIQDKLSRLRALAEQSANGTYGEQSKQAINTEANALVDEIERLYNTAEYNGIKLHKAQKAEPAFTNTVARRNTSTMTPLSSITDESQPLTADIYSISSVEELEKLARITNSGILQPGCEFVLACNIDLSSTSNWTPIGYNKIDLIDTGDFSKCFRGIFDGNGYVIKNLNCSSDENLSALFGSVVDTDTVFKNLGLENVCIEGQAAAALLALAVPESSTNITIENCYSTGRVDGTDYSGGLVGAILFSSLDIKNCWSSAEVKLNKQAELAEVYAGGLVGLVYGSTKADNCYAAGNVIITNFAEGVSAGGLIGFTGFDETFGKISNCYSLGKVEVNGSGNLGGFIGYAVNFDGCIENCFYNNANSNIQGVGFTYIQDNLSTLSSKTRAELEKMLPNFVPPKLINISFQVGINRDENSTLFLETSFFMDDLYNLREIGL